MTKPIEWRGPSKTVPGDLFLLIVKHQNHDGVTEWNPATPADLVAALAAMPEGERAEVLRASGAFCVATEVVTRKEYDAATARAEKAEAEITEVRRVLVVRENAVTASTAAWRMGEITAATVRAEKAERESRCIADSAAANLAELHRAEVRIEELMAELNKAERERSEWRTQAHHELGARPNESLADAAIRMRTRAEKAERERDDWKRLALARAENERTTDVNLQTALNKLAHVERERDEARLELDRARASLDVVRHDLAGTRQELREAREDRNSLRARLIAAESAAAAREPEAQEIERLTKALDSCTATLAEMTAFKAREMIDGLTALRDGALQPREYPLAEGSRIQGETLVTAGGVRMSIRGQVSHCRGPSLDVELKCRERYWLPLRDVLALAHRRGLV